MQAYNTAILYTKQLSANQHLFQYFMHNWHSKYIRLKLFNRTTNFNLTLQTILMSSKFLSSILHSQTMLPVKQKQLTNTWTHSLSADIAVSDDNWYKKFWHTKMANIWHPILTCDLNEIRFYNAMHYSVKHGIVIACRLSVCLSVHLSVTLVDQDNIGCKSWKLIARTISLTPWLFVA